MQERKLIADIKSHAKARELLRSRVLNAIPQTDVYHARLQMESGRKMELPDGEGEFEFRLVRRDMDLSLLREIVSYMTESCVYPYSVHLPAYQLGDGEKASDAVREIGTVIESVDPSLFVLHVSKPSLKKWGPEVKAMLNDLPPDRIIALENVGVDGDKMRFPDRVKPVLDSIGESIPDNLGFCLDVTHLMPRDTTRGTTAEWEREISEMVFQFMDEMGDRLRHMHLSNTRYEGRKRLQHLPFEQGILDMAQIKNALRASGFSGKCVLEFNYKMVGDGIETWNAL